MLKDAFEDEVDDDESKRSDDEANDSPEDGLFGFFDFASVASGSHIVDAADYDENGGDDAEDTDDGVDYRGDGAG